MAILFDTSVLAAYAFAKDQNHTRAEDLILKLDNQERIVVIPVLSELFYFINVRSSYRHAIQVFTVTCAAFRIEHLINPDLIRMQAIMTRYADAKFDFTDAAIMAVAERLKIKRIATFDYRDFGIYRPDHCDYFDLLPR